MSAGKMLHTGYFVCTHTLKNYREHCMCVSSARARGVCEIMNMHLLMCVNSVIYQTLPGHSPATDELQLELQDEPRMRAENASGECERRMRTVIWWWVKMVRPNGTHLLNYIRDLKANADKANA